MEPSNQTVAVGMSLMLDCQATASGAVPLISWQKDGIWLNDLTNQPWRYLANNSLFYPSVSSQDVGKFRCGAVIRGTSNVIYSRVADIKLACMFDVQQQLLQHCIQFIFTRHITHMLELWARKGAGGVGRGLII